MSWRESPPLELHDSALQIVDLSPSYAYSASIELPKTNVRVSENRSFLAVLLASPGDENCISRTVANDTCFASGWSKSPTVSD